MNSISLNKIANVRINRVKLQSLIFFCYETGFISALAFTETTIMIKSA